MPRLSINETTTYRWNFEEDVAQLAAMGFRAIGVWRQKLADFGDRRGIELLASSGLAVSNVCWAGGFTGSCGRSPSESVIDAIEAIRLTAELRADCLVVYTGSRAGHTHNHARRLFRHALEKMLPFAEEQGVTLAIKPVHVEMATELAFLTTLKESIELLDWYENPRMKLAFDTYHMGWDPEIPDRVAEIASRVAIVHLGDGHPPTSGEVHRSRLGEGLVPLKEIVTALEQGGYTGYYDVKLVGMPNDSGDYRDLLTHCRARSAELLPAFCEG